MKTMLKTIALCLAIGASVQTIKSYADEAESVPELINNQRQILMALLSGGQVDLDSGDDSKSIFVLSKEERKKVLIESMVHYIRLIEGEKTLIDEIKIQVFPDLDIRTITSGRMAPGI